MECRLHLPTQVVSQSSLGSSEKIRKSSLLCKGDPTGRPYKGHLLNSFTAR